MRKHPSGPASKEFLDPASLEIDLRHLARRSFGFEVRVVTRKAEQPRSDVLGEEIDIGVVALNRFVIFSALLRDTVFSTRELILESQEVFVRLQLRIVLDDHQQAAERSIEFRVRVNLFLRIPSSTQGRARIRDFPDHRLLLLGTPFHPADKVRNEIRTPRQRDVYLRPLAVDGFPLAHQAVAVANDDQDEYDTNQDRYESNHQTDFHKTPLQAKACVTCVIFRGGPRAPPSLQSVSNTPPTTPADRRPSRPSSAHRDRAECGTAQRLPP